MGLSKKSLGLIREVNQVIADLGLKLTVRQVYYQLVSKHLIPNSKNSYKSYNRILTRAREQGLVDDDHFLDTSKPILIPKKWDCLSTFLEAVKQSYHRDHWQEQTNTVMVLLEKDALRGVFKPITDEYQVKLVIGRGYQSHTNIVKLARWIDESEHLVHLLYFGDFDPSGLNIIESIEKKLRNFGVDFALKRIAITPEQARKSKIPPLMTKKSDSRAKRFIELYGDNGWELDALNPVELRVLIKQSILEYIDLEEWDKSENEEASEIEELDELIDNRPN